MPPPSIAIVHHHLRRGGVTRVIETTSAGLRAAGVPHVVLSGEPYHGDCALPVQVVDGLGYADRAAAPDPAALLQALRAAVRTALGTGEVLWHLHNHSLGKHARLAETVALLAADRDPLLLQIHDFAEDGRPADYRNISDPGQLYPVAPQVHYAFLNSRDRDLLVAAGLPATNAHLLPNPVVAPPRPHLRPPAPDSPPLVLYPVRGIRRKNLGELCLLAALAPPDTRFAVTLAPENPRWQPLHDAWQHFATARRLPVTFAAVGHHAPAPGAGTTFPDWLTYASHCLTTSVAEGFGLAFLEPLAIPKPVIGRDLPEITRDFHSHHLLPGPLYHQLLVPADTVDPHQLRQLLTHALTTTRAAYQFPTSQAHLNAAWSALHHHDSLDFGNLPEPIQQHLILHHPHQALATSPDSTHPAAHWLHHALTTPPPQSPPPGLLHYSPNVIDNQRKQLYQSIVSNAPSHPAFLAPAPVLDYFLAPERFHFLRT